MPRKDFQLLDYWDEHLAKPSLILQEMRQRQCAELGQPLLLSSTALPRIGSNAGLRLSNVPNGAAVAVLNLGGMAQSISLEFLASYLFDRELFQGTSFTSGRTDVIEFDPGLGLSLQLLWRR